MSNNLSPPGSSVYSSSHMYVGDGTWDAQRNTFLLPNLQGLNLETTQYNGMGNRFRNDAGYRSIVKGHGILAVITFLFIVPFAILTARFYHRSPRMALRLHIWLQIMTVLLSTALFILGFQAVGAQRALTNPHHGIGVALYTMVMFQAISGCLIHRREKGKERFKVPLQLMFHQWLGRVIALLGIVQVALGLTLYGAPKVLFILYAVWGFVLVVAYFVLSYRNQPEMGFDDQGTYITERTDRTGSTHRSRRHSRLGRLAAAGAAGAGLAALRRRSRSRSRRASGSRPEVLSSRQSGSYVDDEKYTEDGRPVRTWKDRLLGAGMAAGGIMAIRSLFNRKKHPATETGTDVSYSRPIGHSEVTQTDLSRLEEGRAPASPANDRWRRVEEREAAQAAAMGGSPLRSGYRPRRSGASIDSFDSRADFSDHHTAHATPHESHGVRDGIAALGVAGFLRHQWNKRRNRKEDARVEELRQQDIDDERVARANSHRRKYTGDGSEPPRRNRPPSTIISESDISGATPALGRSHIPPPPSTIPPPPRSAFTHTETVPGPSAIPPPPPPHPPQTPLDGHGAAESGSEGYVSAGGREHRRHRSGGSSAPVVAAAAGAASAGSPSRTDRSRQRSSVEGSVASPPVSIKVKMHNDGRHVTLRRLKEEEAAAEREARKQRKNRTGSISSISNMDNDRWRRTEALEAQQAAEASSAAAPIPMPAPVIPPPPPGPPSSASHQVQLPPPPPIPAAAGSMMSSPSGTTNLYGTETDVSNYDASRRRRRAERAQAKQARMGGSRVEFS